MSRQTAAYKHLDQVVEDEVARAEILPILKDAPYLRDYRPLLQAYTAEIDKFQALVAEMVSLEIKIKETTSDDLEDFQASAEQESRAFVRWGINNTARRVQTRHGWVVVKSARFKQGYAWDAQNYIANLQRIAADVEELYTPIAEFASKMQTYKKAFKEAEPYFRGARQKYRREMAKFNQKWIQFAKDSVLIRKGVLSRSVVLGIVTSLQSKTDLSRYHPGD